MTPWFGRYPWTAVIVISLGIGILAMLPFTNRGDLTSAVLVLVAFTCFVAGLFIFSFQRNDQIDQQLAATMIVPYSNTLSRILADLGVTGHAHFIRVPDEGTFPSPVMQFNPVISNIPAHFGENMTFVTDEESPGLLTVPSGLPVLAMMEKEGTLTLPSTEPELLVALREVNQDLLEICGKATATRSGDEIILVLENFWLIETCIIARDESPQNCITAPCPICSLAGIMVTKGLGKTSSIRQVLVRQETGTVEIHIGVTD